MITVNLSLSYIKEIDNIVGENKLYCSRSELIRVAIRDFLIKTLKEAQTFTNVSLKIVEPPKIIKEEPFDETLFVRVPVSATAEEAQFKTFRIIKK